MTINKITEVDPKRLTRQLSGISGILVTKVTDSQAEDIILRDYILSAASVINASGGSNGKNMVIAVVKSSLIDLEIAA